MQELFWWWHCSDRYIISLSPHFHTPLSAMFTYLQGEVGLYFDVDDAVVEDAHAYGSEHLLRIEMNEKLGENLVTRDLVKVKGDLDRRGHFRGVIPEEFRRGKSYGPFLIS